MAEQPYGVYVSVRNTSGELVSSHRQSVAEVQKDFDLILGEGGGQRLFAKFSIEDVAEPQQAQGSQGAASVAPAPVVAVQPQQSTNPSVEDIPAQGFESCEKCGTLKDQWKPPGVSQAGKAYSGFFGCPNWRNH